MSTVKDQELEAFDITVWYRNHVICPNCGINLREMHPLTNLYPHWTGGCRNPEPLTPVLAQKTGFWQHIKWLWRELE